jgi:CRISPR-associated protein (TIGR03984 family)
MSKQACKLLPREIITCADTVQLLEEPIVNLHDELTTLAIKYKLSYLLGFALDGVIWGKCINGKLQTAFEAGQLAKDELAECYSAELNSNTLQEARLFSQSAELHIWRVRNHFQGRLIRPSESGESDNFSLAILEKQRLWGDAATAVGETAFTLLQHGQQGFHHAVPLQNATSTVHLVLQHYLTKDTDGQLTIAQSRLRDLA